MKKIIIFYVLIFFITSSYSLFAGNVKVKLSYPSADGIPSLVVILKNTKTGKIYTYISKFGENNHVFKNISSRKYIAYCFENIPNSNYGAGYTKAVPCGLSINCEDHSFIEFYVTKKGTTNNIYIADWYSAELPAVNTNIK